MKQLDCIRNKDFVRFICVNWKLHTIFVKKTGSNGDDPVIGVCGPYATGNCTLRKMMIIFSGSALQVSHDVQIHISRKH